MTLPLIVAEPVHNRGHWFSVSNAHARDFPIIFSRQKLVAMFVRTRCFQPVPDEIVPLIVDYGFHVGFC